jgi:hypothetical protein
VADRTRSATRLARATETVLVYIGEEMLEEQCDRGYM